jgi:hypothetical protein
MNMRWMILAGAALAVSACSGGGNEANEANAMAADNMMMDPTMDPNLMMDQNGSMNGAAGAMGANGSMDANTQNMMQKDAATNDPDTNLSNGL